MYFACANEHLSRYALVAKSRDELGKENDLSLRQYFVEKYGREDGMAFKRAQRNFVTSFAG